MSFNEQQYKKLIMCFTTLNQALPEAIIINEHAALINEVALKEKEHPVTMDLLYAIIETVCKLDYLTNHHGIKNINVPLLYVSRQDVIKSLDMMLLLK